MYCVQLPSKLTNFKSISVKPYFWPKNTNDIELDKLKALTKLDKLEIPVKLDKLEIFLSTLEVPCKLTKPAIKCS